MKLDKIRRITTNSNFSYENVTVHRDLDIKHLSCYDNFITNPDMDLVVIETSDGQTKILTDWSCRVIELRIMNKPIEKCTKVSQLVLFGELSFGPVYIIDPDDFHNLNIPKIFKYQLAFVSDNILHIARQQSILEMTH
jgi:hypothetical protein